MAWWCASRRRRATWRSTGSGQSRTDARRSRRPGAPTRRTDPPPPPCLLIDSRSPAFHALGPFCPDPSLTRVTSALMRRGRSSLPEQHAALRTTCCALHSSQRTAHFDSTTHVLVSRATGPWDEWRPNQKACGGVASVVQWGLQREHRRRRGLPARRPAPALERVAPARRRMGLPPALGLRPPSRRHFPRLSAPRHHSGRLPAAPSQRPSLGSRLPHPRLDASLFPIPCRDAGRPAGRSAGRPGPGVRR